MIEIDISFAIFGALERVSLKVTTWKTLEPSSITRSGTKPIRFHNSMK